jgi:photosystem II stability/assembly factor-like uncharacterized protein
MKKGNNMNFRKFCTLVFLFAFSLALLAQRPEQFTPYDDLPGINKMEKPEYHDGLPEFARMLYRYPVNFRAVEKAFEEWEREHPGEENAASRYFINWSRVVEDYALQDGTIQIPDPKVLFKKIRETQLTAYDPEKKSGAAEDPSSWTFLGPKETHWLAGASHTGPAPWQVNVYSFDVAPSDNNVLYCGTETGFVNKTTDGGMHWSMMRGYYFGGAVTAIAIAPDNADVVYAAAGKQIHKTTDGGQTWKPLLTTAFNAARIKVAPDNPLRIAAAGDKGVLISNDGGATWNLYVNERSYDVEFKPSGSDTIFAVSVHPTLGYYHIWRSVSGDTTWKVIQTFDKTKNASGALLAMTPANPDVLYVALLAHGSADVGNTDPNDSYPFIYKATRDAAGTWNFALKKIGEAHSVGGLGGFTTGQGYFDFVLEASPDDENLMFFGTCSLWRSADGGETYEKTGGYGGKMEIHPDIQDIKLLPNKKGWVSTDGGMTYTLDHFYLDFRSFFRINGLVGSDFWGFDQGWNEDIVVGGRYHNGNTAMADFYGDVALRMGGAESPTGWVIKGKSRHVAYSDIGGGKILPKHYDQPLQGTFVFSKFPNMEQYGGLRGNLVQHPNYYNIIYLGEGNALWISRDFGTTFELLHTFSNTVRYFDVSFRNPSVMYVDVNADGLYRTENGGETWEKTSLSSSLAGWTFLVISPYNENTVYACLRNGAWSAYTGKVYRSTDGGKNWTDWTGSLNVYMKGMAIQPTSNLRDLVYVFTKPKNGKPATCWYRKEGMSDWAPFDNNYPVNFSVNMGLPFFRDAKLRVGGSGGVWESPLADTNFLPVVNPWVQSPVCDCTLDTLYFDDHSMLKHNGASWHWEITPEPLYKSDPNGRRFKVVPGNTGAYTVTLTVVQGGHAYKKTVENMVYVKSCPSVYDCDNPGKVPKSNWSVLYVDSQEPAANGQAVHAIDDDESTIWHTQWVLTDPDPEPPHEIQVDMADTFYMHQFIYLPRQDNSYNGTIKDYRFYVSDSLDGEGNPVWGNPVSEGTWEKNKAPKVIDFSGAPLKIRYFRLVDLSEVNEGPWASASELSVIGCFWEPREPTAVIQPLVAELKAFPVPAGDWLHVPLPHGERFTWTVYSLCGAVVDQGTVEGGESQWDYDTSALTPGTYMMQLRNEENGIYRVKFMKMK